MKPKVAVLSLTSCAGCQLSIYFIEDILLDVLGHIDLVAASMLKEDNSEGPYDVAFVEGSVVAEEDLERLKKFREASKVLVALGACACHGCVQSMKNFQNETEVESVYQRTNHLKKIKPVPLDAHVKVDFYLSGCPPEKTEIIRFIQDLLLGKKPVIHSKAVCYECALRENNCLLDQKRWCLGPLIRGGCDAKCPSRNHECTGCHGPIDDANVQKGIDLLKEKGFPQDEVMYRLRKYAGLKFEVLNGNNKA